MAFITDSGKAFQSFITWQLKWLRMISFFVWVFKEFLLFVLGQTFMGSLTKKEWLTVSTLVLILNTCIISRLHTQYCEGFCRCDSQYGHCSQIWYYLSHSPLSLPHVAGSTAHRYCFCTPHRAVSMIVLHGGLSLFLMDHLATPKIGLLCCMWQLCWHGILVDYSTRTRNCFF